MELLQEWGIEILFALISAAVMGYAKWYSGKLKQKLKNSEAYIAEQEKQKIENTIELHLEPIYQELEDLRKYVRDNENIQNSHINLIIASYKFRLVQLCKIFLSQNYITTSQLDQVTEFYKLYTGLGGNGQAKIYYEKVLELPVHKDEE